LRINFLVYKWKTVTGLGNLSKVNQMGISYHRRAATTLSAETSLKKNDVSYRILDWCANRLQRNKCEALKIPIPSATSSLFETRFSTIAAINRK
jgi:hypothetical protein